MYAIMLFLLPFLTLLFLHLIAHACTNTSALPPSYIRSDLFPAYCYTYAFPYVAKCSSLFFFSPLGDGGLHAGQLCLQCQSLEAPPPGAMSKKGTLFYPYLFTGKWGKWDMLREPRGINAPILSLFSFLGKAYFGPRNRFTKLFLLQSMFLQSII